VPWPLDPLFPENAVMVQEERARMLVDKLFLRQIANDECGALLADAIEDRRSHV
jgi:hypothetical protein